MCRLPGRGLFFPEITRPNNLGVCFGDLGVKIGARRSQERPKRGPGEARTGQERPGGILGHFLSRPLCFTANPSATPHSTCTRRKQVSPLGVKTYVNAVDVNPARASNHLLHLKKRQNPISVNTVWGIYIYIYIYIYIDLLLRRLNHHVAKLIWPGTDTPYLCRSIASDGPDQCWS